MPRENSARQIIKPLATVPASIPLAGLMTVVLPPFDNLVGRTTGAVDCIRPTHPPECLVAFVIVHQVVNVVHGRHQAKRLSCHIHLCPQNPI